jgi:hypothetical protein
VTTGKPSVHCASGGMTQWWTTAAPRQAAVSAAASAASAATRWAPGVPTSRPSRVTARTGRPAATRCATTNRPTAPPAPTTTWTPAAGLSGWDGVTIGTSGCGLDCAQSTGGR